MMTAENRTNAIPGTMTGIRWIHDYVRCDDMKQLRFVMENINRNQYQIISITQDSNDIFTVFFRRCAVG